MTGSGPSRGREVAIGAAAGAITVCAWCSFILVSRWAGRGSWGPLDLGAVRFAFSGLIMLPVVLWRGFGGLRPMQIAVIGTLAGHGFGLLAYTGFSYAPAAHGAVLMPGALPFMTTLAVWLVLGERPSRRRLLGLALILAGIVAIGWTAAGSATPGAWRGDLCFLAAVSSWSVYTLLARKWHVSPLDATVAVAIFGAVTFLPVYALLLPSRLPDIPPAQVLWQGLFHGGVAVVVATFAFTRTLRAFGPTRTTLVTSIVPGAAALAAVPVLGEPLGPLTALGVAAVTAGMIVGVTAPARPRPQ